MIGYVLMTAIVVAAFVYLRSVRMARRRWLTQLNLPGAWHRDAAGERRLLRLGGELEGGRYVALDGSREESGVWRLSGHTLVLHPDDSDDPDASQHFDIRLFDTGRIGIDGPGREREVYVKRADNVIELRARS